VTEYSSSYTKYNTAVLYFVNPTINNFGWQNL